MAGPGRGCGPSATLCVAVTVLSAVLLAPGLTQPHDLSRRRPLGLKIDQALLLVHNELIHENLTVSWLSDYCYQCLYQDLVSVPMSNTSGKPSIVAVAVDSQHPITLHLNGSGAGRELPRIHYHFGEFGNYSLVVKSFASSTKMISCDIIINQSPVNSHLPRAFVTRSHFSSYIESLPVWCERSLTQCQATDFGLQAAMVTMNDITLLRITEIRNGSCLHASKHRDHTLCYAMIPDYMRLAWRGKVSYHGGWDKAALPRNLLQGLWEYMKENFLEMSLEDFRSIPVNVNRLFQ